MSKRFTPEQDKFIIDNIDCCDTMYELTDLFNSAFPEHFTTRGNLSHRMCLLGVKKGSHNIRPDKVHYKNPIGTIITYKDGGRARIKTQNGYVSADKYFKKMYFNCDDKNMHLVHLNNDSSDYSRENLELVNSSVYAMLSWRKWRFSDKDLTKAAIMTAKLLMYFPDIRHNENQMYGVRANTEG